MLGSDQNPGLSTPSPGLSVALGGPLPLSGRDCSPQGPVRPTVVASGGVCLVRGGTVDLASTLLLLFSWPEPLVCLLFSRTITRSCSRSSHRHCSSPWLWFYFPALGPLRRPRGSRLGLPGPRHCSLWGQKGTPRGGHAFPGETRAADGLGSRSLEPCSFRSKMI